MRLTLLRTSPRVAPGVLTREAWRTLDAARTVLCDDVPTADALRSQGVDVVLVPDIDDALRDAPDGTVVVTGGDVQPPSGAEVRTLPAAYDAPGSTFVELVAIMDRLRADCPWDREQTHRSLAKYLLEEAYETLEAIESGDLDHLREELGDLLLQVCFHARVASEDPVGGFDVDDVARGIADKLVYRHPHVFAGLEVTDADEVDRNWEALKAAEKQRSSPLEGIPPALPALAWADKVLGRLTKAGVVGEELPGGPGLGDRLLALVVEARSQGLDPEQELRVAVRRVITATTTWGEPGQQPADGGLG